MGFFSNLFGRKRTMSHHEKTLVDFFRASAPTSLKKLSDKEIYNTAMEVMGLFKLEYERRGISGTNDNLAGLALNFLIYYEVHGRDLYLKNLQYNIDQFSSTYDTTKNIADKVCNDMDFRKQTMKIVFENIAHEIENNSTDAINFFNENIGAIAKDIAGQVNNKIDSKELAMQFTLEELDAARQGDIDDAINFVKHSGFSPPEYIGAMKKTRWRGDGDKLESIQMLMRSFTYKLSDKNLMCRLNLAIVDEVMKIWKLGKYDTSNEFPPA